MRFSGPDNYDIRIRRDGSYMVRRLDGTPHFVSPATRRCPKLYLVGHKRRLVYVGITSQPVASRLRTGLKATGKHGYHGYKWKSHPGVYRLHIHCVHGLSSSTALSELETVEAEIALLCRNETRQWPLFQNEIHFHPSRPVHRKWARRLFDGFRHDESSLGRPLQNG